MNRKEEIILVKKWMAWQFSRFLRGAEVDHNIKSFLDGPKNARIPIRVDFMLDEALRNQLADGKTSKLAEFPTPGLDNSK